MACVFLWDLYHYNAKGNICTVGGSRMHQFDICVRSFRQVQDFVALAMVQPFEVLVGNEQKKVNGKSFIGMFTLDYTRPLPVHVNCSEELFGRFRKAANELLA